LGCESPSYGSVLELCRTELRSDTPAQLFILCSAAGFFQVQYFFERLALQIVAKPNWTSANSTLILVSMVCKFKGSVFVRFFQQPANELCTLGAFLL